MKLIVQALRNGPPGSRIVLTQNLEAAIKLLKEDGWGVTLYAQSSGEMPLPPPDEDECPPPPAFLPRDR